ncbi:putative leucine-rich repeat-containing protein DDB_G0290503 isoform X2 [Watersipora subatra]|uniref:putative leucine-rich repeat-containing protein DDB_G0290503 isoform X2 n=1 Tax=Watersipora subatra TaxID=2589382 RepID=UPI00355BDA7C
MDAVEEVDFTILVGCMVTVVVAGAVMAIMRYSFASQEAEYGHHISTLYGSNSSAKVAKVQKKKRAKLAKAKASLSVGDSQHSQQHVAIDPEPVVLGDGKKEVPPIKVKPRKRALSKSILHNKDEVPLVQPEEVESREEFTPRTVPLDERELYTRQHSHQTLVSTNAATLSAVIASTSPAAFDAQPASSGAKGKKKSRMAGVLESIDQSELSAEESCLLVEELIKRQSPALWEKQSRVTDLTEQVEKLQMALESEKTSLAWTNEKLQEANGKFALAERNQMTGKAQMQEMQRRLQQLHEQHRAEVQGIQQARFQEIQRVQQHSSQLREENQRLRQVLPNTDEMAQMRTQLRVVEAELKDQQRHVAASEGKCQELSSRLSSANEAYRQENLRCTEFSKRVEELSYQKSHLDKEISESQAKVLATEGQLQQLREHLRDKDLEIKELHSEILAAKQTAAETISTTSLADNNKILELEAGVAELQSSLDEKQRELTSLETQLAQVTADLERVDSVTKPQQNGIAGAGDNSHQLLQLEDKLSQVQLEVEEFRNKNNELKKQNWSISEELKKAEPAAASVALLEAELDEKSSLIHDLKAQKHSLNQQNNELMVKIEQLSSSTTSNSEELRKQLHSTRQQLDEKEEVISSLELSLIAERDRVAATELECKNILENELNQTLSAIEDQHAARIGDLLSSLGTSEARITDLERMLHQSESRIKHFGQSSVPKGFDSESLSSKSDDTKLSELSKKVEEKDAYICQLEEALDRVKTETGQERSVSESTLSEQPDEAMRLANSGSLRDFSSTV